MEITQGIRSRVSKILRLERFLDELVFDAGQRQRAYGCAGSTSINFKIPIGHGHELRHYGEETVKSIVLEAVQARDLVVKSNVKPYVVVNLPSFGQEGRIFVRIYFDCATLTDPVTC